MMSEPKRFSRRSPNSWPVDEDYDRWAGPIRTLIILSLTLAAWAVCMLLVYTLVEIIY